MPNTLSCQTGDTKMKIKTVKYKDKRVNDWEAAVMGSFTSPMNQPEEVVAMFLVAIETMLSPFGAICQGTNRQLVRLTAATMMMNFVNRIPFGPFGWGWCGDKPYDPNKAIQELNTLFFGASKNRGQVRPGGDLTFCGKVLGKFQFQIDFAIFRILAETRKTDDALAIIDAGAKMGLDFQAFGEDGAPFSKTEIRHALMNRARWMVRVGKTDPAELAFYEQML